MIFDSFSWEHLKSFHDAAKTTHLKDRLFSWKITIPTLRDISVPTSWNNYKFFSMTQKFLEVAIWKFRDRHLGIGICIQI